MLVRLDIRHFTIVDTLGVEFGPGFTTITGETGAGKSIMLDALGLLLGDRASAEMVRPGARSADLSAEFDIAGIPAAGAWLDARELRDPDAPQLCLLRRTLGADGRSRAFVNGTPVTLQDVRELADELIDIHAQHEHQSLLRRPMQRRLLDAYGGHDDLAREVAQAFDAWRADADALQALQQASAEHADRRQLLAYQIGELDELAPGAEEFAGLETEQRRLAHAEEHARSLDAVRAALEGEDDDLLSLLGRLQHRLDDIDDDHQALTASRELLAGARVHLEEAAAELRRFADVLEPDPERLALVESRLSDLLDLARKHRVDPRELTELYQRLQAEFDAMEQGDERIAELQARVEARERSLLEAAGRLSKARARAAGKLEKAVKAQLEELGMPGARFAVRLAAREDGCSAGGLESVEFLVSANPGMEPGPLGRIASGGELSRISLAIQVITAATSRIPSLVLDEADVGIGGGTAEVVGRLLRRLGAHAQVLAVTHLPQVAAQGHQHLAVEKRGGGRKGTTSTSIRALDEAERIAELARMLGGIEITDQTRAHASEMLQRAASA